MHSRGSQTFGHRFWRWLALGAVLFWLLQLNNVADAAPLEIGTLESRTMAIETEVEVSETDTMIVYWRGFVEKPVNDCLMALKLHGKTIAGFEVPKDTPGTSADETVIVPAKDKIEWQTNCEFAGEEGEQGAGIKVATLGAPSGGGGEPGVEGKEGPEGKEGKEGKEGPVGPEGPSGSGGGASSADVHDASDEGALYVLGGMAGLVGVAGLYRVLST